MKLISYKKNSNFKFLSFNKKYALNAIIILTIIISINSKKEKNININPLITDKEKENKEKSPQIQAQDSLCKLESIHIPLGNSLPVMVYNASALSSKKKYRLTVLEKDDVEQFNVDGNLFYTDKNTKESWYINESMDDSSFDKIKDAINMCKDLNKNKNNFIGKDKMFSGLRKNELPSFMSKRVVSISNRISGGFNGNNFNEGSKVLENLNEKDDKESNKESNKENNAEKNKGENNKENKVKSFLQIY